jgi:prepilin-type processing-associated H-X9-DG protein
MNQIQIEHNPTESVHPSTVLMYCPAKNHKGDGGNVLFADGHVEWVNSENTKLDGMDTSFEDVIGTIGKEPKP